MCARARKHLPLPGLRRDLCWDICTTFFEDTERNRVPCGNFVRAVTISNPHVRDLGRAVNTKRCHTCGTSALHAPKGLN